MRLKHTLVAVAVALCASGTAFAQADNTNSRTDPSFHSWMHDYSRAHNERISREAYMAEAGRRWDMMDREHRGLTTQQIDSMYGTVATPNMVNGGSNRTNPTGTELKGQNSGGK